MAISLTNLAPADGELYLLPQFYPPVVAETLFKKLRAELHWQQEQLFIYGKSCTVPRLTVWYADPGLSYRYSGLTHLPEPWHPVLQQIRQELEQRTGYRFNGVLGNFYRDGQDSMGYHADAEPELGRNPVIASLSFGEARVLKLRHRTQAFRLEFALGQGDLLIMAGSLQHHWQHALPKTRKPKGPRINLSFRQIITNHA